MANMPGVKYLLQQEPRLNIQQKLVNRLIHIFWRSHYDILEIGTAIPLLLLSLQILNPYYSTFGSNPGSFWALNYLGEFFYPRSPELPWGILGLSGSLLEIWACLYQRPYWRVVAPVLMFVYLSMFALCLGFVNPFGTGVATYVGLAILSLILIVRSMKGLR